MSSSSLNARLSSAILKLLCTIILLSFFTTSSPLVVNALSLPHDSDRFLPLLSKSILGAFNTSVDGTLFAQRPIGAVCYPRDALHDVLKCLSHLQRREFFSDAWISDQPSAYQESNWGACGIEDSCYVSNAWNLSASCEQGRVPDYAIHARTSEHVVKYVQFAVKHDLPIVIKNTGHDFKGRSSGKGGFALWTHLLTEKSIHHDFVPKGCQPHHKSHSHSHSHSQSAVRLGAGVDWLAAYRFADEHNVTLVGGDAPQVGAAGGWLLGGGHSFLTPSFGLGVDNLLEMDIVTSDGVLRTISQCSEPDLFWAVRGGGPATFGVVVSVTYKAYPPMPIAVTSSLIKLIRNLNTDDTRVIVEALAASAPRLAELGVGGLFSTQYDPIRTYVLFVLPNRTKEELEEATAPFFDAVRDIMKPPGHYFYPTFYSFYTAIVKPDQLQFSGSTASLSSRLVPKSLFTPEKVEHLVDAVQEGQKILLSRGTPNGPFQIIFAPPTRFDSPSSDTSIHPTWYESWWHVIYAASWDTRETVQMAANPLRTLTPGGGAYQNEADVYEPDHQQSFWGSNYARLARIKRQVDPDNIFQVWQGVDSMSRPHSSAVTGRKEMAREYRRL